MAKALKLSETGFRPVYHNFCVFPLLDDLKPAVVDFPGAEEANCILTYGYIDQQAGLTLEVLVCGDMSKDGVKFFDPSDKARAIIRAGKVLNEGFHYLKSTQELYNRNAEKLATVKEYDAPEDVEKTRELTFLDELRHKEYPDDVPVFLVKDGLQPEQCWVRMVGTEDHYIIGDLLNEPDQNFGYHKGERIGFGVQKTEDEKIICISVMNPDIKLTAEDLEDGQMLCDAIAGFNEERTEDGFFEILELLRDSFVWVPCTVQMGENDTAAIEKMVEQAGDDPESLKGTEFTSQEQTYFVPDILQNGDAFFFPAFSSIEAMGEYGESFSKVRMHMLDVIGAAKNCNQDLVGIVIDAFTEPFVLEEKVYDIVENMKSRIEEAGE